MSEPEVGAAAGGPNRTGGAQNEPNPDADPAERSDDGAGLTRVKKSPNAFRTISEVADDLHIPQHVLRFWETKFPQVKPMKRGGGRRYYRPTDIVLLRRIANLLYTQGYTIKGVQRLLRDGGGQLSEDIPPAPEDEREAAGAEHDELTNPAAALLPGLDLEPNPRAPPTARAPLRRRVDPNDAPRSRSERSERVSPNDPDAPGTDQDRHEIRRLRSLLAEALTELEAIRQLLR